MFMSDLKHKPDEEVDVLLLRVGAQMSVIFDFQPHEDPLGDEMTGCRH